jgi:hypothetical protein
LLLFPAEYQLESFVSAYRSCLKETDVFVYSHGNQYLHTSLRYPFLVDHHGKLNIPDPEYKALDRTIHSDRVIGLMIFSIFFIGLCLAMLQLKLFEWCREKQKKLLGSSHKKHHGSPRRGEGDSVGLRVWHQHNWRNSPSPASTLTNLLSMHYHEMRRNNASMESLGHDSNDAHESAPLLSAQQDANGGQDSSAPAFQPGGVSTALNSNDGLSRRSGSGFNGDLLGVPGLRLPEGQRKSSWDVDMHDNDPKNDVGDLSPGILARKYRHTAPVKSIMNFKGKQNRPYITYSLDEYESSSGSDDESSDSQDGADISDDGVIDRGVAFTVLGLHRGSESILYDAMEHGQANQGTDASNGSRPENNRFSHSRRMTKSSPMPATSMPPRPDFNSNTVLADALAARNQLLSQHSSSADPSSDDGGLLGGMSIGKSRRRSAPIISGSEPTNFL